MYAYADANDLCDKKYSDYVKIKSEDDDEKGVPFENDELEILWKNQEDPIVEMLLIICYSGFRISEYIDLEINWNENYLEGGLKTFSYIASCKAKNKTRRRFFNLLHRRVQNRHVCYTGKAWN